VHLRGCIGRVETGRRLEAVCTDEAEWDERGCDGWLYGGVHRASGLLGEWVPVFGGVTTRRLSTIDYRPRPWT